MVGLLLLPGCEAQLSGHRQEVDGSGSDGGTADQWLLPADGFSVGDMQIDPTVDTDNDGLPDGFEELFSSLDPTVADSDGDSVPDGQEDEDGDGLTALEEWAAWQLSPIEGQRASPEHKDLLVELDAQQGEEPPAVVLQRAIEAFAAVDLPNPDNTTGIAIHFYKDELGLAKEPMQEALTDRMAYLAAHGPHFGSTPPHVAKMVHVIFASDRPDAASRGGDTVGSSDESPDKAGVLIYVENLKQIFPVCATPTSSAVTLEEGLASTLVHELGHSLQLGHDTEVNGGVNSYNIMSTDLGDCDLLQHRTRGVGNSDPALGATEQTGGPRFSQQAAALIKLTDKISVEASCFDVDGGYAM